MRVLEIDGLRAVAMTMVIAQHCGLLPFGWTGVWLFYVISGFVITRGFLAEGDGNITPGERYGNFMLRRFFRIVPVYCAYLFMNVALLVAMSGASRLADIPYLLTFTYNWHMIFGFWPGSSNWGPFGHLWTLSVEEQFYLVFPLIALFLAPRMRLPLTIALVCAGPVIRFLFAGAMTRIADSTGAHAFSVYSASVCHFDTFLLGSLLARMEPTIRRMPELSNRIWALALGVSVVYAVSYVTINYHLGASGVEACRNVVSGILSGQHREVFVYSVVDLLACALLVHAMLRRSGSRLLASPPMTVVGQVSYGGYLFHALVLWYISQAVGGPVKELPIGQRLVAFAIVWGITVAAAYASFRWFESPVSRWGRRAIKASTSECVPSASRLAVGRSE